MKFLTSLLVVFTVLTYSPSLRAQRIKTFAGITSTAYAGDGSAATLAAIGTPTSVVMDGSGNIYIADATNSVVRKVDASGIISTFAGTGTAGLSGDGADATAAQLNVPAGLAIDGSGNVYISELSNNRVRMVNTSGVISTVVGGGVLLGDGGPASLASLNNPMGICFDLSGNMYIADRGNNRVRKVDITGIITTFAGTGTSGIGGDGGAASIATIRPPSGVAADPSGNIYIALPSNNKIRVVDPSGTINTYAGTGGAGSTGDGSSAVSATLSSPISVCTDGSGNLYITDQGNSRIRMVNTSGTISLIGGTFSGFAGDGLSPTVAQFNNPAGLFMDGAGILYIADGGNSRVRYITPPCNSTPSGGNAISSMNLACASTTFALDLTNSTVALSGDLTYQWQASADNATWSDIGGATTIPFTLAEGSALYYQCIVTCPTTATSSASSSVLVNFSPLCYCSPQYIHAAEACGFGITMNSFRVHGELGTSILDGATCTGTGYIDQTALSCAFYTSVTYLDTISCSGSTTLNAQVWIDFNDDGIFSATDSVGGVNNFTSTYGPMSIVIPISAPSGVHRMRVVSEYSGSGFNYPTMDPCTSGYSYGETRDYSVNILPLPPCSGTPTAGVVTAPYSTCITGSFNLGLSGSSVSGGLVYQWQFSLDSTAWGDIAGATSVPYMTTEGFTTYYRCKITCTAGGAFSVTPGVKVLYFPYCYCTPSYSAALSSCTTNFMTISQFTVAGEAGSTLNDLNSCDGTGYQDNESMSVNLMLNGTYTVTIGEPASTNAMDVQVWIDFGNDGVFGITDIVGGLNTYAGSGVFTITMPIAGTLGTHRMRVVTIYDNDGFRYPSLDPCAGGAYDYGEARDYSVNILPLPACSGTPATATVSAPYSTCLSNTLTLDLIGSTSASSLTYQWESSPDSISWTPISGATYYPYTFTPSATSYYRCTVTCTPSGLSAVTRGLRVYHFSYCYCTPSYSQAALACSFYGVNISQYTVVGVSGTMINDLTVCNGAGYEENTNMSVTLKQSSSYIATILCSGIYNVNTQAWIDFGDDGTFDASESVGGANGYTSTAGTYTIIIPAGAAVGMHRMRIVSDWGDIDGFTFPTLDPCTGGYSYGEARDYMVNIIPPVCSGTPTAGTVNATVSTGCSAYSTTLSLAGSTVATGLTYRWESSTDNISFSSVSGATNATFSPNVTSTVYYRCGVTCTASGLSDITPSVALVLASGPLVGAITGGLNFCQGTTSTLADTTAGGTWSSSDNTIATVDAGGVVTGVSGGSARITYSVTNVCGVNNMVATVNITALPSVAVITGTLFVCVGATTTLADATSGGTWSSTLPGVATVSGSGVVTGVSVGTTVVSYTVTNSCGTAAMSVSVPVNPLPVVAPITGSSSTCVGSPLTLTESTPLGTWSSSNTGVATISAGGTVTPVSVGSTNISYSLTNGCGTTAVGLAFTVVTTPSAGTITGSSLICTGFTNVLADGVAGGTWSSSNSGVATVDGSGNVTGVTVGSANISYIVSNSCGSANTFMAVTVTTAPTAGFITGTTTLCAGTTTTLVDATSGGTWSSSNTSVATVNSSGMVTAITPGSAVISYSVSSACGTAAATAAMTIITSPSPGVISGAPFVCVGSSTTLADGISGGTWGSSTPSVATISSTGDVTGVSAGGTSIFYSVTNACGTATTGFSFSVNPLPNAGALSGATAICNGHSSTLSSTISGGSWSSSNAAVASVSSTGTVNGLSAGSAIISYSVTNSCGTDVATHAVTVSNFPSAGTIVGPSTVCLGSPATFSDTVSGGVWAVGSTTVATVNPSTGVVTGVATGTTNIYYFITNVCGSTNVTVSANVSVMPNAGTITGLSVVCQGATVSLSDTTIGGVWSSSDTSIGRVSTAGVVTGVNGGAATISYTYTNACGSAYATLSLTVNPLPAVGTITGNAILCMGFPSTYTDTAGGGSGTWSTSSAAIATVSGAGVVTPVSVGGVTVSYSRTNGCGTVSARLPITISDVPASGGTIGGATSICPGDSLLLTDTSAGGLWSSSDLAIATVNAMGKVFAVGAGNVDISYSITNTCGSATSSVAMTVNPIPDAGSISVATTSLCPGATLTATDAATGGLWISLDPSVATIDASGLITGVSTGSTLITYTVTNACGTAATSITFDVLPAPVLSAISGPTTICQATTATMSDTYFGGTWTSSDPSVGTIDASTGTFTAVTPGFTTVTYSATNIFSCTTTVTSADTVTPAPDAGSLSGTTTNVCSGATISFTDGATGGTWSSSDMSVATVDATGVVTGVSGGSATISYTVSNSCGTVAATADITVNPAPILSTITGATTICSGVPNTLSNSTFGGVWTSSDASIATVTSSTGIVTGVAAGVATITYTVTNIYGCSTFVTIDENVNPSADPGTLVVSTTTLCAGQSVSFIDTTSGGTWSSSNTAAATVDASGLVTSVAAGTTTISYTVDNSFGCSSSVTADVTVNPSPAVGPVTGATSLCLGSTTSLSEVSTGGSWSSANPSVATVDPSTGDVTGSSIGTTTISYTILNAYGCSTSSVIADTVSAIPSSGTIGGPSNICTSSIVAFTDAATGGTWSSSNSAIATIDPSTGMATGVTAGSVTLSYVVYTSMGCSTMATAAETVSLSPFVGAISGPSQVCENATAALSEPSAGGVWSSSDMAVSTVDASGVVHGVGAGVDTIVYTITDGLGCSTREIYLDTVNPSPVLSPISGTVNACLGLTNILTNSTTGGTWTTSNMSIATVDASGTVTGVALGTADISYTVTNSFSCSTTVSISETVHSLPTVASIGGPTSVCPASTITLTDATSSGSWSSSNVTLATVVASTGVVTGVTGGAVVISYTVTNAFGCPASASYNLTVNAGPSVTAITGATSVCLGYTTVLADATSSGTWTSSTGSVATINSSGVVTSVSAGTTTISYTVVGALGCTASATTTVTVNALPSVAAVGGPSNVCIGNVISMTESTTGGTWSSSNSAIATVDTTTGDVTGVAAGTVNISYTVHSAAGCPASASMAVNVQTLPSVAAISGPTGVCIGQSITLSDATSGGTWTSSNPSIAAVSGSGSVAGVSVGTATITYTITSSFGCPGIATASVAVNDLPTGTLSPSSGSVTLCNGIPVNLSVATSATGFQWLNGGSAVTGATNSTYTASSQGTYSVRLSNGGCTAVVSSVTVLAPPNPVISHGAGNTLYTGSFASYQWYRNGTMIPGATNSVYVITTTGNFTVVVTDGNGCSVTSAEFVVSGTTGITTVSVDDIRLFPNPATSVITIEAPVRVNVSIMAADGKVIIRSNDATNVDVSNLANGMYMIMIYSQQNELLKADKFIKAD